jgi:peptide/nickel transport system substrate-binding protein
MQKKLLAAIVVVVLIIAGSGVFFAYNYSHPKGTDLPAMKITAIEPLNALDTYQLGVIVSDLKALGLPVSLSQVTAAEAGTWSSPSATPQFVNNYWGPDWQGAIAQMLYPFTGYSNGGSFGANEAWTTNATLNSSIALSTAFNSNTSYKIQEATYLTHLLYSQYDYLWLPSASLYFFVQPYVNGFQYNQYTAYYYNMLSYNSSYAGSGINGITLPSNTSTLTDVSAGTYVTPMDYLDPSHGFTGSDAPIFQAVFQQIYGLTPNLTEVPVLAAGMPTTPSNGVQNQNYSITLRNGIHFSTGTPVNATTIWFSLYRTIVMAQGASVDNYGGMLFSTSAYAATSPYSIPVGWLNAMEYVSQNKSSGIHFPYPGNITKTNVSNTVYAADYLANMLSHYSPWSNSTQAALVSYANQAIAVPGYNMTTNKNGVLNLTINLDHPYSGFISDLSLWWGNTVDPLFIDSHDGVTATQPNNYTDTNPMPGTGPYSISSAGSNLASITLSKVSNYWGNAYWNASSDKPIGNFPSIAQPAHIQTIVASDDVSHSGRVSGFLDNDYQISYTSSSYISSIVGVTPYKNLPLNSVLKLGGINHNVEYISMNNHMFPTNNLYFREAMWYAINQTAIEKPYYYNGTYLATNYIGPVSPAFASEYANFTAGLSPETYNVSLAEHFLNLAGQQAHFYVILPNGTVLGDKSLVSRSVLSIFPVIITASLIENNLMAATAKYF